MQLLATESALNDSDWVFFPIAVALSPDAAGKKRSHGDSPISLTQRTRAARTAIEVDMLCQFAEEGRVCDRNLKARGTSSSLSVCNGSERISYHVGASRGREWNTRVWRSDDA